MGLAAHDNGVAADRVHALGQWARRPLLPMAAMVVLGVGMHRWLLLAPAFWLALAMGMFVLALWRWRNPTVASLAIICCCGLTAIALGQAATYRYPADEIARFTGDARRLARLELELTEPPRTFVSGFGQVRPMPPRQVAIARVRAVATRVGWRPAGGEVLLQINEPDPRLAAGQIVRALAMLDRPAAAMNPGQFDWADYYRRRRVLASAHVVRAATLVRVAEGVLSPIERWRAWTRARLAEGFTAERSLDHALLRALVLGDSDPELRDVQEQFRATGVSHHLAISGTHIAVVGGVVFFIVRLLRGSPKQAWGLALGVVALYFAAALPQPPVVRSVLLWAAFGVAVLGRRPADALNLLAAVVMAMLLWHPLDLFDAGFQLSFVTVLGLVLLTLPLARALGGAVAQPVAPGPYAWLSRTAAYIDSRFVLAVSAALAAWLVAMPIVAGHFGQLNVYAIVFSILLAPLVFAALLGGVAKILLTALWPPAAGAWAWAAGGLVALMRQTVELFARLPWGDVPLPAPAWWVLLIYFGTLLAAARPWRGGGARLAARLSFGTAAGLVLLLPFALGAQAPATGTRVTLLSVGAGQCAVIEPPSGRVVLIDAGSASLADPVRRSIGPFLRRRGITAIDTIIVSHANADHFNAVAELAESYAVREVLVAGGFETSGAGPAAAALTEALRAIDRPPRRLREGDMLPLGAQTALHVLWSRDDPALSDNDRSLVLRLDHAGGRLLFTGDIEAAAIAGLLAVPDALRCDVLIAPHHGSAESNTAALLAAARPASILASNDRSLTGKQRTFDRIAGEIPLFRTHDRGAVTVGMTADGVTVEPFLK